MPGASRVAASSVSGSSSGAYDPSEPYTAMELASTTRRAPSSRATSSTVAVPCTFSCVAAYGRRFVASPRLYARCTIASTSRAAAPTSPNDSTSPATTSTPPASPPFRSTAIGSGATSSSRTRWPRSASFRPVRLPMIPVPPVTSTRTAPPQVSGGHVPLQLSRVRPEVDLEAVALRVHEVRTHPAAVRGDLLRHRLFAGQRHVPGQRPGDPPALDLDQRDRRADGLHEAGEVEPRRVGVHDPPVQPPTALGPCHQVGGQEGERRVVAGGVDDDVGGRARAVGEADRASVERRDVGPHPDPVVGDVLQQLLADGGVLAVDGVRGPRHAEPLLRADGDAGECLHQVPGHRR